MKLLLLLLLTVCALLLQPIVDRELPTLPLRPNLLLASFVIALLRFPGPVAVIWGAGFGLLCDSLTGPQLGMQMALFALLAMVVSFALPQRPLTAGQMPLFSFAIAFSAQASMAIVAPWLEARPLSSGQLSAVAGTAFASALLISGLWIIERRLRKHRFIGFGKVDRRPCGAVLER